MRTDEELERKIQSPYHFSLSKDDIGEDTVHHFHPQAYPEGVSDEKVTMKFRLKINIGCSYSKEWGVGTHSPPPTPTAPSTNTSYPPPLF